MLLILQGLTIIALLAVGAHEVTNSLHRHAIAPAARAGFIYTSYATQSHASGDLDLALKSISE